MFVEFDFAIAGQILDFLIHYSGLVLEYFLKPFSRFHWPYLASSVIFAGLAWAVYERGQPRERRKGFLSFLFPRAVWLHRSAILDYKYVLFDKLLIGFVGATATILAGDALLSKSVEAELVAAAADDSLLIVVFYTAVLLLTEDLFRYGTHRAMHRIPFLWEFHKVHHSPEVLVPLSLLRTHPVNGLLNITRSAAAVGLVSVVFLLVFPKEISPLTIFGVNVGRVLFNVCAAHLRHSHVWLGFGPVLSRVLISPAMHQVHHSVAERHWDRNFGSQFAIWDWMFGSLYVPRPDERHDMKLGLGDEETAKFRTVRDLYLVPFRQSWRLLKEKRAWSWAS